ncbi:MAG: hypothetical protein ACPL7C_03370 [Anaerolineae bacterium]|jgi:predicted HTH domain antitoxin
MAEMATLQIRVPQEWAKVLEDQTALLEIIGLGLEEYRIRRALLLYQKGAGSLGYGAEVVGIPERVLMEEARRRGILPHYEERFVEQDLGQ